MTRFESEISGRLGEFWIGNAKKEANEMFENVKQNGKLDEDGAVSWKSNGHYLPDDCCEKLEYAGFRFSRKATGEKRKAEEERAIEAYMKRSAERGMEERTEMQAAFGKGVAVVDIITGQRITQ